LIVVAGRPTGVQIRGFCPLGVVDCGRLDWMRKRKSLSFPLLTFKIMDIKKHFKEHYYEYLNGGASYLGNEPNSVNKVLWSEADLRVLFCRLSPYSICSGSHTHGLFSQILLENTKGVYVDAGYVPEKQDLKKFKKYGIPFWFGVSSKRSASDFDVLAISISVLMEKISLAPMLRGSGISLFKTQRIHEETSPILIAGGASILSCEELYGAFGSEESLVDLVFLGEGDTEIPKIFSTLKELKEEGLTKKEIFKYLRKNRIPGVFEPDEYVHSYEKNKLVKIYPRYEETPEKMKRVTVEPGSLRICTKKPLYYSLSDVSLGKAEIEISRGCPAFCSFCHEGWVAKRYREIPLKKIQTAIDEARVYQAATKINPFSFNFSYYSKIQSLIEYVQKNVGEMEAMSNRVDVLYEYPELSSAIRKIGNRSLTIGVEGISEHLRTRLCKNIPRKVLREVLRNLILDKYTSVKMYMIWTGWETLEDVQEWEEDLEYFISLKKEFKSSCALKYSFMNLLCSPHTPLQFSESRASLYAVTGEKSEANELFERVFSFAKKVKVPARIGRYVSEQAFLQLLSFGGRNLTEPLLSFILEKDWIYYNTTPEEYVEEFGEVLKNYGMSWEEFFNEKPLEYVFPYDYINTGVPKEFLFSRYRESLKEKEVFSCLRISEKIPKCVSCGACSNKEEVRRLILSEREKLDTSKILPKKMSKGMNILRVVLEIQDPLKRVLRSAWIKTYLVRGFLMEYPEISLKAMKNCRAKTEEWGMQDWSMGEFIVDLKSFDNIFEKDFDLQKVSENLGGFEIKSIERGLASIPSIKKLINTVVYAVPVPTSFMPYSSLKEVTSYPSEVKIKKRVKDATRGSFHLEEKVVEDIPFVEVAFTGRANNLLVFEISWEHNPSQVLAALLKKRPHQVKSLPPYAVYKTRKREFSKNSVVCEGCGGVIPESVSPGNLLEYEGLCFKCAFLKNFRILPKNLVRRFL